MKKTLLFLACITFSAVAIADSARLKLWIIDPIGVSNGFLCNLQESPAIVPSLPVTIPTLTEQDITAWNPTNARWTLNHARFSSANVWKKLQDHCFVLAIDGKLISSGVVLSSNSARLTGFPTISVYNHENALYIQLTSSNHGSHMRLIHVDALDAVLDKHTQSEVLREN